MRSRTATATTVNAVRPSEGVKAAMAEGEERNLEDESLQVPDEKVDETGSEDEASDSEAEQEKQSEASQPHADHNHVGNVSEQAQAEKPEDVP